MAVFEKGTTVPWPPEATNPLQQIPTPHDTFLPSSSFLLTHQFFFLLPTSFFFYPPVLIPTLHRASVWFANTKANVSSPLAQRITFQRGQYVAFRGSSKGRLNQIMTHTVATGQWSP